MKKQSKALGPTILLLTQYLTKIMGPLIAILLVRYLGKENYGLYASALAITSFLSFIPEFGLQQSILKLSVETNIKLNKIIKNSLYISLIYTLIAFIFLVFWLFLFKYEIIIQIIAYIMSMTFVRTAIMKVTTTILQVNRDFTRIGMWSVFINASIWIFTVVGMLLNFEMLWLIFWPQFAAVVITFIMLIIEGRKINLFSIINPFQYKDSYQNIMKNSIEFGTANSMYQMYHRSDAMILSAFRSPAEVGYFNIAFRISELVNFFASVLFNQVLYPIFFKWSKENREKYLDYYRLLNKIMVLFGFYIATQIILYSNEMVFLIFGSHEYWSVLLLNIIILAVPLRYLVISLGAILTTDNLVRERIKKQSKIAVINIVSNAIFVPIYGPVAAAFLIILTDLLLFISYYKVTNRNVTQQHFSKTTFYLAPILVILLVATYFWFIKFSLVLKIAWSILLTIMYMLFVLLSFNANEKVEIKNIILK